jgi:hypothetical protein
MTAKSAKMRKFLTREEVRPAAMYLATTNLGFNGPKSADFADVERAWLACQNAHAAEGVSVYDEFQYWRALILDGDAYCAEEWERFKSTGR